MLRVKHSFVLFLVLCAAQLCRPAKAQNPGQNINVIEGAKDQFKGDRFLQRQNEPTIAVSSRNPDHLLAAANDYRTVDLKDQPVNSAGPAARPDLVAEGWMGVYRSYDRGRTWRTWLLPGFPQDRSPEGVLSPAFGMTGASDPVIASGLEGRIYLGGLVYDRLGESSIFVTRYTDQNNIEGGDSFKYDFTKILASRKGFPKGRMEDKPAIATDIPRPLLDKNSKQDPDSCGRVYVTFTQFNQIKADNDFSSKLMFSRSTDCGVNWSNPVQLNKGLKGSEDKRSQGSAIAVDPNDGTIYVVWRTFNSHFILISKSTDGGTKFSDPISLTGTEAITAFDQSQPDNLQGAEAFNRETFRSNAFPTIAVDVSSRVYVAWQERVDFTGSSLLVRSSTNLSTVPRIVITSSTSGGNTWSARQAVQASAYPQVMPWLTAGLTPDKKPQVAVLYYESARSDKVHPETHFISGIEEELHVRVAQATVASSGPGLGFVSTDITQYTREAFTGEVVSVPGVPGIPAVNRPNLPMYANGTTPFIGDYIALVPALPFVRTSSGWQWPAVAAIRNLIPTPTSSSSAASPINFSYHAIWTENRDVIFPETKNGAKSIYGNWAIYSPPGTGSASCVNLGSRNANIYSAEVANSVVVGSPGTFKQLGAVNGKPIQRSFILYVQNQNSDTQKLFRLTILDSRNASPPVVGSFFQTEDQPVLDILVYPNSTVTQTVYVASTNELGSVTVAINEIASTGTAAYSGSITFNADPTNPKISNPKIANTEIHNPKISNPKISNPKISNPTPSNPKISNPSIENPKISNPKISNYVPLNSTIGDQPMADITWTVTNDGNTTSAFTPYLSVEEIEKLFPGYSADSFGYQLITYRTESLPALTGCDFLPSLQDQVISVVDNPKISNPKISNPKISNPKISNPKISNSSFFVAPGDSSDPSVPQDAVYVTLRVFPPTTLSQSQIDATLWNACPPAPAPCPAVDNLQHILQNASQTTVAESINTVGGELTDNAPTVATAGTALLITTPNLPDANRNVGYSKVLEAVGGSGSYIWSVPPGSLPEGMTLSETGLLSGAPTSAGDFNFTVTVTDRANLTNSTSSDFRPESVPPSPTPPPTLYVADPNTSTTLTVNAINGGSLPSPLYTGTPVELLATVLPLTCNGVVSFLDNGTNLVLGNLNHVDLDPAHQARYQLTTLPAGSHSLMAVFASSSVGCAGSVSGPIALTVQQATSATTTTLTSSGRESAFGQAVSFIAQVNATAAGAEIPSGDVVFKDGGTSLGTVALNALGRATLTVSTLTVGTAHSITAQYLGAAYHTGSTSNIEPHAVTPAETLTLLESSPNPSRLGQPVAFSVTVKALPPSDGVPVGTVTFMDGPGNLGTAMLSGGIATIINSGSLSKGSHTIIALYSGGSNFKSSTSAALTQDVSDAAGTLVPTTTGVSASPNTLVYGQPVLLTATVTPTQGTTIPTGTAYFKNNGALIGDGLLNAGGQASFTYAPAVPLPVGSAASITAAYLGDSSFSGSTSSPMPLTVNKASATVVLGNLTQTYTGSPLMPTATTTPPGLPIVWTNAPQTNAGTYQVTATINDTNYQGSASGTFVISKASAPVVLGSLTQNYTGSALMPTAATTPPGLAISWTGAPQTNAGSYPVTAAINDTNYQGSASGTFTISKAAATVVLGNLTQSYTGSALTPTATTTPAGLSIVWTNAPQSNAGSYQVTAMINNTNYQGLASGTFVISNDLYTAAVNYGVGFLPESVAVGDFNGDGKLDLATANLSGNNVSVLLGNGNGTFRAAVNYSTGSGSGPVSVAVGDFNGDAKLDLVAASANSNTASVLLGNGDGTFGVAADYPVGSQPLLVVVGDFNGDGKLDLATANWNSNNVSVLLGNGNGIFGAAVNCGVSQSPHSVAVGDFNGDGKPDLATANANGNNVSVLLGRGNGTFDAAVNYGVGSGPFSGPFSIAVGDLNGDGKLDLATANHTGNEASVLLGNGNGTFGAAANYGVGSEPQSVVVGDFNGDGKPDLAIANYAGNSVSVLLGNGNGIFSLAVNLDAGSRPDSVAVGDFNADGNPDLVTANYNVHKVSILLHNSMTVATSDLYIAAVNYGVNSDSAPYSVAVGDFNGDSKPDLATANMGNGSVSVLLGNGNGTFASAVNYGAGSNSRSLAVSDFNGDGKPDLATANSFSNTLSVLLGNGNGTFGLPVDYGAGSTPRSVAVGDFNGDGKPDLATANEQGGNVSVLLGNGNGTFSVAVNCSAGTNPWALAVGDFNGDGKPDLATANGGSGNVSVLLGNGNGTFGGAASYGVGTEPGSVAVGDFNGDGKPDLATANGGSGNVSVLLGNGNGTFSAAINYGGDAQPQSVAVGDFNGDGKQDLAITNVGSGNVSILLGNGNGTFGAAVNYGAGNGPTSVAVGDFNRDGKPDLAAANVGADSNVSVLLGNGNGTFGGAASYGVGTGPGSVAVGDFNGDGKLDLATANGGSGNVSVLLGNGNGTFGAAVSYGAGTNPQFVAVGDFNGDGKPDLAIINLGSGNVSVLLGNGNGTFGAAVNYGVGSGPHSVAVGDFNGDGKPDLATANYSDNNVSVLLGNGNGTFGAAVNYASGFGPYSVAVGDFNGDGKLDLATANFNGNKVSILLGNGSGAFAAAVNYGVGAETPSVAVGDFNGDGKLDLATANYMGNDVSVLLGNGNGTFGAAVNYGSGSQTMSVAVGDFNRDGKLDLATANGGSGNVSILLGNGNGTFGAAVNYGSGAFPVAVAVGDFNGDGKPDLAAANTSGNNVSVLLRKP